MRGLPRGVQDSLTVEISIDDLSGEDIAAFLREHMDDEVCPPFGAYGEDPNSVFMTRLSSGT